MSKNARALKLKAHAEEFDSKKEDLKRLIGALEDFATEAVEYAATRSDLQPVRMTLAPYRQFRLDVRVEYFYSPRSSSGIWIKFIAADRVIENESELHLEIVRLAHDNMDTILEAVEEFCRKADCVGKLKAQFQRFLV